jgi:hypothetical protein
MAYAVEACLVDPLVLAVKWGLSGAVTIRLRWSCGQYVNSIWLSCGETSLLFVSFSVHGVHYHMKRIY